MPFDRERMKVKAVELAAKGVFIGTSSWKYEGLIVEGERYEPRRKTYIYVNNRLEGNALGTIEAMLTMLTERA